VGAQTQRAVENFPISGEPVDPTVVHALGAIKGAAARANAELGVVPKRTAAAIARAAAEVAGATTTPSSPWTCSRPDRARRPT